MIQNKRRQVNDAGTVMFKNTERQGDTRIKIRIKIKIKIKAIFSTFPLDK